MKRFKGSAVIAVLCGVMAISCFAQNQPANRPPVIKHEAITTAVKGQSISVRALVADDTASIKSVSLFYTASKDAAPFKIEMQNAGVGSYFGSIPSTLIKGISGISYYIEAIDDQDAASETPWYTVKIQTPQPAANQPVPSQPPVSIYSPVQTQTIPAAKDQVQTKEESWSWKGPAIIAGAAAAVVGGAIIAANSGSKSSSDDSSGSGGGGSGTSVTNAGTYSGTATRYLQMTGGTPSTESYAIVITVTSSGAVSSDTLHPGAHVEAPLYGTAFQMTAPVTQTNLTGQVIYSGSLLNNAITGPIAGAVTSSTGTNGTYSGNFSATKQ